MEPFFLQNDKFFIVNSIPHDSLIAGITTRNGGVSVDPYSSLNMGLHVNDDYHSVIKNRNLVAEKLEFPLSSWVAAEQTHEVRIQRVSKKDRGTGVFSYENALQRTDGFFTREKGVLLTLCFADCVPLFFTSKNNDAIGICHAGWRGTVQGIGEEMVKVFMQESIPLKDILVVIGPSICENCYIVDEKLITLVENKLEHVDKKPYNLIKPNQYRLNLKNLNKLILLKCGLLEENIFVSDLCSACEKELFFSHRRDQGKTGRMMGFIGWKED